jgi:hypothetical protein
MGISNEQAQIFESARIKAAECLGVYGCRRAINLKNLDYTLFFLKLVDAGQPVPSINVVDVPKICPRIGQQSLCQDGKIEPESGPVAVPEL